MKTKVSIVIPCLNEKTTIKKLLSDIQSTTKKSKAISYEIIVVDNGSTDGTLKILHRYRNIKILNVPVRGYGAALHSGIMKAAGEYIVYADADLSYPFSNLDKFLKKIPEKPDLVLGSRFRGKIAKGAMPFIHRYIGTPILSLLVRVLYKVPTTDCNSGMRMVKKRFYKKLNMRCSGMEWASELLLKTGLKKGKYLEVPIYYQKDKRGRSPHLSTWPDGWRHIKTIFLLKPSTLYPFLGIFLGASIFFFNRSFSLAFMFLDMSVVLVLSLFTLDLLASAIERRETPVSSFLKKFVLVPVTAVFGLAVFIAILVIPDIHQGTKLFLVSILGITFMWIFLVETIKTHLVNRLPDIK